MKILLTSSRPSICSGLHALARGMESSLFSFGSSAVACENADNTFAARGPETSSNTDATQRLDRRRMPTVQEGKKKDMGRSQYRSSSTWRRERTEESKRRKLQHADYQPAIYATEFTQDELAAEERRPKRKVAVMIGYSGSGYHGMQMNHKHRTIEGDLFQAFVRAGAVSKANADDPKKISFVRCARTDKGVHAAGNVVSLKLIIEDEDILQKINDHLSSQIRVWAIERTRNSFSAYNLCDSRVYEYLIPSHCFLSPHPRSYLSKRLWDIAEDEGDLDGLRSRQQSTEKFWAEAEQSFVRPALEKFDPQTQEQAYHRVFEGLSARFNKFRSEAEQLDLEEGPFQEGQKAVQVLNSNLEGHNNPDVLSPQIAAEDLELAVRALKQSILDAKKSWRIPDSRLAAIQSLLSEYVGVHNYHNYTVQKGYDDPSAKRIIKSFRVESKPLIKGGVEWLSFKVHGQSFMMHQIRKMVGMAALVVRCGASVTIVQESFGPKRLTIPRAPGLGLLLEKPVFESYNKNLSTQQGGAERRPINFTAHQATMDEFKQREIYSRIFQEDNGANLFHQLFWAIDNLKSSQFLYLSSQGTTAVENQQVADAQDEFSKQDLAGFSEDDEP